MERLTNGKLNSVHKTPEKIMTLQKDKKGYKCVILHKNAKPYARKVHRLVAMAFIPNPANLPQVNHKDTNKENNCVENLEWVTGIENMRHAFANGCFKRTERQKEHARKVQLEIAKRRRKPVVMYSISGEKLKTFNSIREAEAETGTSNSKIVAVCKGNRKTAGGYKWKYKNEKENR